MAAVTTNTVAAPRQAPSFESVQAKQILLEGRNKLKRDYQENASAASLLNNHGRLVDRLLKSVWREKQLSRTLSLLAVGGYGRGQLFPCSDVDILVLLPNEEDGQSRAKLESLISFLWDIGLEIGHSVRTTPECLEQAGKDITVQTNLLEARWLAGNRPLFRQFRQAMQDSLDVRVFCNAKQLEQQQRHGRFHDTAYNLEPNLKESPGGLRDLQTILWISGVCGAGTSWQQLAREGVITRQEALQIRGHETFLQNLRIRLHYLASRREDRLLFDYQTALASELGIADQGARRASEHLMQEYYRTAKAVSQLNTILLQNLRARIFPSPDAAPPQPINERFQSCNDLLEARSEECFVTCPSAILESFLLLQQRPELKGMSAATLRALWRARPQINAEFRRNPQNRSLFMQMLRQPRGITHEFRRMNQYGILGRYIPAFGRIVGQMQHDLYHVYTVDEHILMVVRNLRRFTVPEYAHEYPLCSRLINEFERPEVLYLAALFHDIAKGRGGDHSSLGSVDAGRFCQQHGMNKDDGELVAWLVKNHLMMSLTAQKLDLTDSDVIAAFAARVGSERRLIALYLLTVADIRGTSPKVWNAWKAKLLEDLFWAGRRHLRGQPSTPISDLQTHQSEALALLNLYAIPPQAHEKLWAQLDLMYFLGHEPNEIAWHTRLLNYRVNSSVPVVKARLSPIGEGVQVMIYVPDQKELFARICSFFERINFNIVQAKIHTTRHGYALDSFLVMALPGDAAHYRDLISFIEFELGQRLLHQTPLEPPLEGRLSRQLKYFPVIPEVSIEPDERGSFHILSITAGDQPGLLSRVARTFVAYGINLHSAKITTLGERAVDVFLISGSALADSKAVLRLQTELLQQLQT